MKTEDFVVLLEDRLEEDMRGEYGEDLLRVSKSYYVMPADRLDATFKGMTDCSNGRETVYFKLKLLGYEGEMVKLVLESYLLGEEEFSLSAQTPYHRGVSGYRGKYHDLTFTLMRKDEFTTTHNSLDYLDI